VLPGSGAPYSAGESDVSEDAGSTRVPFVIEWRDGFKVNIAQVDAEHKQLFALVKALDLHTIDHTVEELLNYVVTHFSNEQALMEKSGYPAFEQHLKLHEEFGAQVADFLGNGDQWTEERVHEVRRFLNKWLIGHIMTHDLRFGRWYAEHEQKLKVRATTPATPVAHRSLFARLFGRG
jgi:hemerythrin